jgi:hypothetical protein
MTRSLDSHAGPFSRAIVSSQCPEAAIRVASSRVEREGAFRLAYRCYVRAGLCGPSASGMRATPYQLIPSTDVFIADLHGEVISTLSLVRDGALGLPLEAIYPAEVHTRRSAGMRIAEVSCLADRRKSEARFFGMFCDLARVMVQMANREGIEQLLIAVHPRHASIYRRAMGFEQIGDNRDYPAVNGNPAVALCLDFARVQRERPDIWERFVGAPLPPWCLEAQPISGEDRRYFLKLSHGSPEADSVVAKDEETEATSSALAAV